MTDLRILFVADESPATSMPDPIRDGIAGATSLHVIAPVLGGRIERATDSDEPAKRAGDRLDETTIFLRSLVAPTDVELTSEVVTDPPFEAIQQLLLHRSFERIVVAVRSDGHWKEKDLTARVRETTEIPVVEVVLQSS